MALIVENQLKDDKKTDPERVITHVGFDEISLKKRPKLYVTLMTDLTDPDSPKVLAVTRGRDTLAAKQCNDVVDELRVRFKEIFDTAPDRMTAEQQLAELRERTESLGLDFSKFWTTCDNWKTGILNDFDGRYTSAAVEGINNKARVITKRCYGVKSSDTLWNRLILDLNRASEAVGRTCPSGRRAKLFRGGSAGATEC
ncbi:MAG TPA: transposase [Thermoguttaceae bacterium]|nr:transposase [Thermoguttaceae bacterium]